MTLRSVPLALALLAPFMSCLPAHSADAASVNGVPSNLVLRSYDVPNNGAQRMRGVLRELLWFGGETKEANRYVGRADVGPDGRLIVLAPESVQEGVRALLASEGAKKLKEPGTVRIDYWVVAATPGGDGSVPSALQEVSGALAEVQKRDGAVTFTLLEKLSASGLSNEWGSIDGRDTHVRQFANLSDDQLIAELDLQRSGQRLQTRVRLVPGTVVVLASAGMASKEPADANRSLYFLVRAAPLDGTGR